MHRAGVVATMVALVQPRVIFCRIFFLLVTVNGPGPAPNGNLIKNLTIINSCSTS